jgi:hypothetical protein
LGGRGGRSSLGQQALCLVGAHAVLVPYPAEELNKLFIACRLSVPHVLLVGSAALKGVEEHARKVVDGVSGSRGPLASSFLVHIYLLLFCCCTDIIPGLRSAKRHTSSSLSL